MNSERLASVFAAAVLAPLVLAACRCDKPSTASDAGVADTQAAAEYCRPELRPALPRLDWHGIRGVVQEISELPRQGPCRVYEARIAPKPFTCAASYVAGDLDGSVGQDATQPQTVRVQLPAAVKLPLRKQQEVCAMYDWVDDGKTRIWDSALVAKQGQVLLLVVENGALHVGGFRAKVGIAEGAHAQTEFFRVIVEHPGGQTELRPRQPVTKDISGASHFLLGEAFARRLELPGERESGLFYAVVRVAP